MALTRVLSSFNRHHRGPPAGAHRQDEILSVPGLRGWDVPHVGPFRRVRTTQFHRINPALEVAGKERSLANPVSPDHKDLDPSFVASRAELGDPCSLLERGLAS